MPATIQSGLQYVPKLPYKLRHLKAASIHCLIGLSVLLQAHEDLASQVATIEASAPCKLKFAGKGKRALACRLLDCLTSQHRTSHAALGVLYLASPSSSLLGGSTMWCISSASVWSNRRKLISWSFGNLISCTNQASQDCCN